MKRPIFAVAEIFEALRLVLLGPLIAMAASKMGPLITMTFGASYRGGFWGLFLGSLTLPRP